MANRQGVNLYYNNSQNLKDRTEAEKSFTSPWHFVCGVPSLKFLPLADRPEIAFSGRSNVGKSSLINALTNRRNLARTSNVPGRTQELNFFQPSSSAYYLVDMPGYGYAQAPKAKVGAWKQLISDYLRGRLMLRRVYILIDARHGLKDSDILLFKYLDEAGVLYQLILTKIDKVKQDSLKIVLDTTQSVLNKHAAAFPTVIATSSEQKQGLDEVRVSILNAVS
ncbi:MAG: GTP-binding protein EngB [Hyphomicrobiaceae bacterium hypho_1]